MAWLLRTTEPPDLDPKHPIRDRFTRFGYNVAKHSVAAITISAVIATLLIYPFPFLFTNDFTNGASNLPHHVWSSAQPLKALDDARKPDVVMRSIWVHGLLFSRGMKGQELILGQEVI